MRCSNLVTTLTRSSITQNVNELSASASARERPPAHTLTRARSHRWQRFPGKRSDQRGSGVSGYDQQSRREKRKQFLKLSEFMIGKLRRRSNEEAHALLPPSGRWELRRRVPRKLILSFIFAPFVHLAPLSLMSFSKQKRLFKLSEKKRWEKKKPQQRFFPPPHVKPSFRHINANCP